MTKTSVKTRDTLILVAASALLLAGSAVRASETDDRIESSAKKSYVFKHYLSADSIKTESKNGAVTLTGTVAEESHIGLARDTVEGLPGVKSVDSQLTVKGQRPAEHSDTWVGLKVKTALLFHRNVRATKTDVNVKDGIVSLSGEASSLAQKELTTEYAKDVEGVKEVKNDMTVANSTVNNSTVKPVETTGEKIDDASITAQVKMSLLSHRSTSALKTKVETTAGVVTLTGITKSAAEKALVTKLATDINGVSSVINNMTIQAAVSNLNHSLLPPQNLRIASK
jgi:hyperosmotically inducible protein